MRQNTPDEQSTIRADIGREVERVSKTSSKQFEDIIVNARWFTTLVVAEVAAIAKLAQSANGARFAGFLIAMVVLAISAGCLIFSITLAQSLRNITEKASVDVLVDLPTTDLSTVESREVSDLLKDVKKSLTFSADDAEPQARSKIGLILFLFGSFIAGLTLVLS